MKIAITGVACRLPQGIQTLDELWQFLQSGADGIGEIPAGRWDMEQVFHPDRTRPGKIYTRAGAFFDRIDEFDAGYFNISPREAEKVDPQQRLLLELAAEALDDAGLPQGRVAGSRTGVFVGISSTEYYALQSSDLLSTTAYTNSGGMLSIASNRISYHFDLRGPSLSVDTACSSSLVALHLACESLRVGSSELALVGGANLLVGPFPSVGFSKASMLSPTGRCHTFDAAADGYVRTEGGIVLVLKPLDAALVDGDRVLGVIIGSAVNSDGRTTGLSLPSQEAQADLLRHVYAAAGIAPDQVSYVEAHGTGTPAGDPIECRALASVLGGAHRSVGPLPLGSIKSNIGHLEPGSGLAGLMKALLVLRHGRVPANLHFRTPNPAIDFEALNLHVVAESVVLPAQPGPRVVGINSFGFGGTNAHVVVEQAPALIVSAARPAPVVQLAGPLLLSASSPQALAAQASRFASFLDTVPAALWPAVVHTAACHRTHLPHRLVVREHAPDAAARALRRPQLERDPHCAVGHVIPGKPRVALVFSGNGAQWWGMGRRLVADDAIARATVERVGELLLACGGCSLMDVFAADSRAAPELLDRAEVAQPALLALQLAIVESLRARGMVFDAVMGHSVGEIPAACVAGALTLEQAVRVVHARSVTQQRTRGAGRMAAVGLGRDACATEIAQVPGWIEIVCINSTRAVTLAGDPRALARDRKSVV